MSLFVKLDAECMHDPRILAAGYAAELLYLRSLQLAKRIGTDGFIASSQLVLLALGMPSNGQRAADALVREGLWTEATGGWLIAAWLKHNPSQSQINETRAVKAASALVGNHERWHSALKPSRKCSLCVDARWISGSSQPDRTVRSTCDSSAVVCDSAESPEQEQEQETEQEPEPYRAMPSAIEVRSSSASQPGAKAPQPIDLVAKILDRHPNRDIRFAWATGIVKASRQAGVDPSSTARMLLAMFTFERASFPQALEPGRNNTRIAAAAKLARHTIDEVQLNYVAWTRSGSSLKFGGWRAFVDAWPTIAVAPPQLTEDAKWELYERAITEAKGNS